MLSIECLNQRTVRPYLLLIKPTLRAPLLEQITDPRLRVFGAAFWGKPAGAAVVTLEKRADLLDLYVLPDYRGAGIGAALLTAIESELAQHAMTAIQALYRADEHTAAWHALLAKAGWVQPERMSRVFWNCRTVRGAEWVARYQFRPPYEVFTWTDLSADAEAKIAKRGEEGWYPPNFSPFNRPMTAWDPETSVGLRYKGEVVGWVLTIREAPDRLFVETMFVDPPLQRLGRGFMLVGESTRRYYSGNGNYAYWRVAPDNEPMLRWSRRAFGDHLVDEYDEWYSKKVLAR
ncbi:MAG TPA: GNAT family N-acetyltransferase [Caldilineaceae bacterium]|nr:GNAT family N-acetyltransferase [Caldilineaceae bacterium]